MIVSTESFSWNQKNRTFFAELSDLQWMVIPFSIELRSARTGRVIVCQIAAVQKSQEGEVEAWVFKPTIADRSVFSHVTVVND